MASGRKIFTFSKIWKWLGKHDVQYDQTTRRIWKHSGNIGGTARYGKWQNVMASDRKL